MKTDQDLSRLLRETRTDCGVPGDFQAQVWQKISRRSGQGRAGIFSGFWERMREGLLEPRYGYSLAILVVLAGLALGQVQASAEAKQAWSSLEGKYVASIDPYTQSGHNRHP